MINGDEPIGCLPACLVAVAVVVLPPTSKLSLPNLIEAYLIWAFVTGLEQALAWNLRS